MVLLSFVEHFACSSIVRRTAHIFHVVQLSVAFSLILSVFVVNNARTRECVLIMFFGYRSFSSIYFFLSKIYSLAHFKIKRRCSSNVLIQSKSVKTPCKQAHISYFRYLLVFDFRTTYGSDSKIWLKTIRFEIGFNSID